MLTTLGLTCGSLRLTGSAPASDDTPSPPSPPPPPPPPGTATLLANELGDLMITDTGDDITLELT